MDALPREAKAALSLRPATALHEHSTLCKAGSLVTSAYPALHPGPKLSPRVKTSERRLTPISHEFLLDEAAGHLGLLRRSFEPGVDDGDVDGGGVADGEFVVAGGEGSMLFELVDTAFDGVAVFVDRGIERGRSSALGAGALAVPGLVG